MKKKFIIPILTVLVLLTPLYMYIAWLATPKKKLVAAIIDKTDLTSAGQEHASLTWVLDHEKFTKNKSSLYNVSNDYFGFFPMQDEKYSIKGLERFSDDQLTQLSHDADLVYVTDAYGIYRNEWFKQNDATERSGMIYGGLSNQDMEYLQKMKQQHKLILTEFNCIASPTSNDIRSNFESTFSMHWTGWTGRYFFSLDTNENSELPKWIIRNYKKDHNNTWPFTKPGIVFVSNTDKVVVLEEKRQLNSPLPSIVSSNTGIKHFGLPAHINYPFWFDVVQTDTSINKIVSTFYLDLTDEGRKELQQSGIPASFPAVQMHNEKDYAFYYFSADFTDNPVTMSASYLKGIEHLRFLFYNHFDEESRSAFFWKFYQPLLTTILTEYYNSKQ